MWTDLGVGEATDDEEARTVVMTRAGLSWEPDECTEEFLAPLLDEGSLVPHEPTPPRVRSSRVWMILLTTVGLGFAAGAAASTVLLGAMVGALLLL
jgi:hypothetical protein